MRRLGLAFALVGVLLATPAFAQEDTDVDVTTLRTKFAEGMEKYKAGLYGEAVLTWRTVYLQLGPKKGYRLAFNLGRAFDQLHDEVQAAGYYEAYLTEVDARRAAGETIEENVVKQEDEAKERIAELRTKLGRLRFVEEVVVKIDASDVQIRKGIAYVLPGKHTLTFRPGTSDVARSDVTAEAGQISDVSAPPIAPLPPLVPQPIQYEEHEEHPYSTAVIWVGAGVTAASFIFPTLFYVNAGNTKDAYNSARTTSVTADGHALGKSLNDDYESDRQRAYISWAIPALLGAATLALTAYWYLDKKTVRQPLQTAIAF
jgi:hypothetical protein